MSNPPRVQLQVARLRVWLRLARVETCRGCCGMIRVGQCTRVWQGELETNADVALNVENAASRNGWLLTLIKGGRDNDASADVVEFDLAALLATPVEISVASLHVRSKPAPSLQHIAVASLQLTPNDTAALATVEQLVFTLQLDGNHGDVEVHVRQPKPSRTSNEAQLDGVCSVQWSSRAALDFELERAAQRRREAEQRLLQRLRVAEARAAQMQTLETLGVRLIRDRHAERVLQRLFLDRAQRKRAEAVRRRQELEDQARAEKAERQAKILQRQHQKSLQFLRLYRTNAVECNNQQLDKNEQDAMVDMQWWREQEQTTLYALHETLMRLRLECDSKLLALNLTSQEQTERSDALSLPQDLIQAVQRMHLRK